MNRTAGRQQLSQSDRERSASGTKITPRLRPRPSNEGRTNECCSLSDLHLLTVLQPAGHFVCRHSAIGQPLGRAVQRLNQRRRGATGLHSGYRSYVKVHWEDQFPRFSSVLEEVSVRERNRSIRHRSPETESRFRTGYR